MVHLICQVQHPFIQHLSILFDGLLGGVSGDVDRLIVNNHYNFRKRFGEHGAVPAFEAEIRPGIPDLG